MKKDWELNRLKQLKEDEERKAEQEEDDMMYTYTKTEVSNLTTTNLNENKKLKPKNKNMTSKKSKRILTNTSLISNINTRRRNNNNLLISPTKKQAPLNTNSPSKKLLKLNKKRLIRTKLKTTTAINRTSLIDNELVKFKKLNEKNQECNTHQLDNNNNMNKTQNKEDKLLSQKQFESSIIKSIKRAAAKSIKLAAEQLEQIDEQQQSTEPTIEQQTTDESNIIKINHQEPKINKIIKEKKLKKIKQPILNPVNSKFIRHLINSDSNVDTEPIIKKPRVKRKLKKDKQTVNERRQEVTTHTLVLNNNTTTLLNQQDLDLNQLPRSKSPTISSLIAQQQPKISFMNNNFNRQPGIIRTIIRPTQMIPQMANNSTNQLKSFTQKPPTLHLTQANLNGNKPILITKPLNQQIPQTKVIIKAPNMSNLTANTPNLWILNRPTQVSTINANNKPPLTVVMSPNKMNNKFTVLNKDSLLKSVSLLKTVSGYGASTSSTASQSSSCSSSSTMDLTSSATIVSNVLAQTKNINNLMSANSLDTKLLD